MASELAGLPMQLAFGMAVRTLREKKDLTREELAASTKISKSSLSGIEDGKVDPTWGTVRKLAQELGITTEQLAELAESFEAEPRP